MKSIFLIANKGLPNLAVLTITILLLAGCAPTNDLPSIISAPANHPPTITGLRAEQEVVPSLEKCQIECIASDPESSELNYEWQVSGGSISGKGHVVTWVAPEEPGKYTVSVHVTDEDGNKATRSITISVVSVEGNRPPQINSLGASDEQLVPLGNCTITCEASDPDGNKLTYTWSASGGNISGIGPIVTWTAPDAEGNYAITVKVIDNMGGENASSLNINVALNNSPIIENLFVTPKEPGYMKDYLGGYKILKGKDCQIECIASDPDNDELSYEWTYDGGNITGEGPVVTWIAPLRGDKVTVIVTVSDSNGGIASKSTFFVVETCTSCI